MQANVLHNMKYVSCMFWWTHLTHLSRLRAADKSTLAMKHANTCKHWWCGGGMFTWFPWPKDAKGLPLVHTRHQKFYSSRIGLPINNIEAQTGNFSAQQRHRSCNMSWLVAWPFPLAGNLKASLKSQWLKTRLSRVGSEFKLGCSDH